MSKRPMTVSAAAALEALEGAAAIGFGLFAGWETVIGEAVDPASAIGVTVLALGGGAGMLACARGILRAEPWSRAPTVLTQLFALPVAWSLWQSEQYAAGLPLGVVAVLALILVLSPPSTGWLVQDAADDDDHELEERGTPGIGGPGTASAAEPDSAPDAAPGTATAPEPGGPVSETGEAAGKAGRQGGGKR